VLNIICLLVYLFVLLFVTKVGTKVVILAIRIDTTLETFILRCLVYLDYVISSKVF
jgi:hypothetical protein